MYNMSPLCAAYPCSSAFKNLRQPIQILGSSHGNQCIAILNKGPGGRIEVHLPIALSDSYDDDIHLLADFGIYQIEAVQPRPLTDRQFLHLEIHGFTVHGKIEKMRSEISLTKLKYAKTDIAEPKTVPEEEEINGED